MNNKNMTSLRVLMRDVSTEKLEEMLQDELKKNLPDGDLVRLILGILEDRDRTCPMEYGPNAEDAWKKYQAHSKHVLDAPVRRYGWVLKVASIALILGMLLFVVPQTAAAKGLFDRIVQWTDSFFELLTQENHADQSLDYKFKTDNPGLQQVYDAVVELGVTEPVVPMWIPEDYQLVNYRTYDYSDWVYFSAAFADGECSAIIQISVLAESVPSSYCKDTGDIEPYETNGIKYGITRNEDWWVAVWVRDNIECAIMLDCQEDEFYRMLDSIFTAEDE